MSNFLNKVRWSADILLESGTSFVLHLTMGDVQSAVQEARRNGQERRAMPIEPWVLQLAAEDADHCFPGETINSVTIRKVSP